MSYKVVETQHGTTEPAKVLAEFSTRFDSLVRFPAETMAMTSVLDYSASWISRSDEK
jgi:hypothetical protein